MDPVRQPFGGADLRPYLECLAPFGLAANTWTEFSRAVPTIEDDADLGRVLEVLVTAESTAAGKAVHRQAAVLIRERLAELADS